MTNIGFKTLFSGIGIATLQSARSFGTTALVKRLGADTSALSNADGTASMTSTVSTSTASTNTASTSATSTTSAESTTSAASTTSTASTTNTASTSTASTSTASTSTESTSTESTSTASTSTTSTSTASTTSTASITSTASPFSIAFNTDQPSSFVTSTHLVTQTNFITPSAASATGATSTSSNKSTAMIIGGVAGGTLAIIAAILLIAFCLRSGRKDSIANFDPQLFRHTIDDDDFPTKIDRHPSFGTQSERPPTTIKRHPTFGTHHPNTIERHPTVIQYNPEHTYNSGSQYPGYTENHAGVGSHGSQSRPAPDLNHTPSLRSTTHLMYNPSSADAPLPPYPEQHYNQQVPPRQVAQNESESASANGYVDYRTAARNVVPQGSPNLAPLPHEAEWDGRRALPPLPPRLGNVPGFSDSNIKGQFFIDPRNLDSRSDLSPEGNSSAALHTLNFPIPPTSAHTVPPRYGSDGSTLPKEVDPGVSMTPLPLTLNRKHSTTRSTYGSEADAYTGIS